MGSDVDVAMSAAGFLAGADNTTLNNSLREAICAPGHKIVSSRIASAPDLAICANDRAAA